MQQCSSRGGTRMTPSACTSSPCTCLCSTLVTQWHQHVSTLVQQCGPALCSHIQQHGPIVKWPYHYPFDTASLLLWNIHPFLLLLLLHCRHCQYYPRSLCTSNLHPHSYCYFHCLHLGFIFRFLFPRIIFSLWLVSCIWTFPYHFTFFFFNPLFVTLLLLLFFL